MYINNTAILLLIMFIMTNNVTNNVIINNITGYTMCVCICWRKKYKLHYVTLLAVFLVKCRYSEKVCEGVSKITYCRS